MNTTSKHPKGLYLLFVTEMWERFSYYGMRALFILYMTQALLFNKELSSQIYGNYTGLVYLTPLIGGYIADRYWGNRRSILWGAIVMALGQFLMFLSACYFDNIVMATNLMYGGLLLLIMGNGLFKPNISTMVGSLYEANDSRKDSAYTIFYMGINAGAMIAPLWCGFIGNTGHPEDFKWGFLSACIGMIISAMIFELFKNRYIVTPKGEAIGMPPTKNIEPKSEKREINILNMLLQPRNILSTIAYIALFFLFAINWNSLQDPTITLLSGADWIGAMIYSSIIVMPIYIITDKTLTTIEKSRIGVIYIIAFFVIFFWAAFEQAGASLTFFADEQTNRMLFGWEMPASYFQSFNAIFIVLFAPVFAGFWAMLGRRKIEPSSPVKQALGLFLLAIGYLIIALGVNGVDAGTKVSMMWLIGLYFIHTLGELCLSPIGLSMVNKLSPIRFSSLIMGVWFLSMSAANKLSGVLSSYYPEANSVAKSFLGYEVSTLSDFFMLFVFMSAAAAIVLFLLSSLLKKMMHGVE
ncbi:MAG: peptide MFS transporter [Rikenellaceae bacterium]